MFIFLQIVTVLCVGVDTFEKRWTVFNDWNLPTNWKPPRLPCPNDKLILSQSVLYIGSNLTINEELTIPSDGEITLGEGSTLSFTYSPTNPITLPDGDPCKDNTGESVEYVGPSQQSLVWTNPSSWEILGNDGKPSPLLTQAAPEIERLPCQSERAVFPQESRFTVEIDELVRINSLQVGKKSADSTPQVLDENTALQNYLETPTGTGTFRIRMYKGKFTGLTISSQDASKCKKRGCKCSIEYGRTVCESVTCPEVLCTKVVTPANSCCKRCGSVVEICDTDKFDFQKCWKEYQDILIDGNHKNVSMFMSRIDDDKVQVLLTDQTTGSEADAAALLLQKNLESKLASLVEECRAKSVVVKNDNLGGGKDTENKLEVWKIIVIVIAIMVLAFVIIIVIRRRRRQSEIKSVKFDNELPDYANVELDFATTDFIGDPTTNEFSNPSYEPTNLNNTISPAFEIPSARDEKQPGNFYVNPAYSTGGVGDDEVKKAPVEYVDISGEEQKERSFSNDLYDQVIASQEKDDELPPYSKVNLERDDDTDSVLSLKANLKLELKGEEDEKKDSVSVEIDETVKDSSEA